MKRKMAAMLKRIPVLAGQGLGLVFSVLKVFRPGRPIHPEGIQLEGRLERLPGASGGGVAWLDEPGTYQVVARLSRSAGLPARCPDIMGLALRITIDGASADILLASTGTSPAGRYVLRPCRNLQRAALTTLMPYRDARGFMQFAARTLHPGVPLPADPEGFRLSLGGDEWVLGLYHARPRTLWQQFATVTLRIASDGGDSPIRFDPVLNPIPGATIVRWMRELREPPYAVARKGCAD